MKLKVLFVSVALSFLVTTANATEKKYSSANEAIASAEMARDKVSKVGHEWRDTSKFIKQAKKLAAKGKNKEAMALAMKAKAEATAAYGQYVSENARYAKNH